MKKIYAGIFAIFAIALLGVSLISAQGLGSKMPEEEREALRNAVESGDYEGWASLKRAQISEERFKEIQLRFQKREEFRNAMQNARELEDREQMESLKAEFGVGKGMSGKNRNLEGCPFAN
jgi:hypothetical protein